MKNYKFFTENGKELTTHTIKGLKDAYWYTKDDGSMYRVGGKIFYINKKSEGDRFYIVNSSTSSVERLIWGGYDLTYGNIGLEIRDGKKNSLIGIDKDTNLNTIWAKLKEINESKLDDCDDWFIGSYNEIEELYKSDVLEIKNNFSCWTSSEASGNLGKKQALYYSPSNKIITAKIPKILKLNSYFIRAI